MEIIRVDENTYGHYTFEDGKPFFNFIRFKGKIMSELDNPEQYT